MNDDRFRKPPYLDPRIDIAKIVLIGALFLILLVGAMIWPLTL